MKKYDRVISENEMKAKRRFEQARNEEIERISENKKYQLKNNNLERSRIDEFTSAKKNLKGWKNL